MKKEKKEWIILAAVENFETLAMSVEKEAVVQVVTDCCSLENYSAPVDGVIV